MEKNEEIIRKGFADWAAGTGNFFDLLDDNMHWTISGSSPLSKTYTSKKQFLEEVIDPLNARLSQKIIPAIRELYTDDHMVIVIWDGTATAKDGKPYQVSYAWFMQLENNKIVRVTAFLDTLDFTDIYNRIKI
jgi:ketosteroid isomerase-like protein